MNSFLLIGLGGAMGSILRFVIQRWWQTEFPAGTLLVNITGCFLIGLFWAIAHRNMWTESARMFLMVGFCGGFTTFSAFSLESLILLQNNRYLFFAVYTFSSVVLGLLATFAGYKMMSNL